LATLSVIVITRNEEHNISACLDSVRWADELIVVDAQSTDRTVEIAREYTPHVHVKPWLGYSEAKELALSAAAGEWVLWVDAYERLGEHFKDGHADSAVALAKAIASSEDAALAIKVGALGMLILWERYTAAKEVGHEIIRRDPTATEAHVDLAEAYVTAGRLAEAKSQTLAALEIAPSFERAQDLLLKIVEP